MMSLICRILKNGTNEMIYKTGTVTCAENKLMFTRGESRGEINWELTTIYKINN